MTLAGTAAPLVLYSHGRTAFVPVEDSDLESVIIEEHNEAPGRGLKSAHPSLKLSEKVWTFGGSSANKVHRGVTTATVETHDKSICVGQESRCIDGDTPFSAGAPEYESWGTLNSIRHRLGPILFQNSDIEAYTDFLLYDDPVDDCKHTHGSLLPLWTVTCCTSALDATCMCWDGTNPGIFAVSFGSLDAERSAGGMVCVYSVSDLRVPRHKIELGVGAMSVAFSSDGKLAVGLQDGGLMVLWPVKGQWESGWASIHSSMDMNHLFPVWNVRWCEGSAGNAGGPSSTTSPCDNEGSCSFPAQPSRGSDHIVTMSNDGLQGIWRVDGDSIDRTASVIINQPGSYQAFDPNVFLQSSSIPPSLFQLKMVCCCDATGQAFGTLEGTVGFFGSWYEHHRAPVYSVETNPFDARYVLAASLDGSMSFWDKSSKTMLLDLDVGEPLVDAQWSFQSSTICAAVAETGSVHVFDLTVSKEVPLCSQRVSDTPLTCVRFVPCNTAHTTLFVGTADGRLLCLKLSPNLRICKNATSEEGNEDFWMTERTTRDNSRQLIGKESQMENINNVFIVSYS
jgi:WD40 repeat protein